MSEVTGEGFRRWMEEPVTQELLSKITALRDTVNQQFLQAETVLAKPEQRGFLLGQRHIMEMLLNISFNDFKVEEPKDGENTSDSTSSASQA